jgi:hypothetical protein
MSNLVLPKIYDVQKITKSGGNNKKWRKLQKVAGGNISVQRTNEDIRRTK